MITNVLNGKLSRNIHEEMYRLSSHYTQVRDGNLFHLKGKRNSFLK